MNELKPFTHQESFEHLMTGDDILEEALDKRQEARELTTKILKDMQKLNTLLRRPCPIQGTTEVMLAEDIVRSTGGLCTDFEQYETEINQKHDTKFWRSIIDSSSITAVMHNDLKEEFSDTIQDDPPAFDREHVYGTLSYYMNNRFMVFVEGALNLFKMLDKNFKSNDGIRIRERIIFDRALGMYGWSHYGRGHSQAEDLERIFYVLDGIDPTQRLRKEWATYRIEQMERPSEKQFEYFKVKAFKNGNIHLWLTRPDLVDKLNEMIAGHFGASLGTRTSVKN